MTMKRYGEDDQEVENIARANCSMLMSRISDKSRLYTCKFCNRKFSSFQALGGHRASHKRSGGTRTGGEMTDHKDISPRSEKVKTHECSICGANFALGQALGGHMRRHRSSESPGKKKYYGERKNLIWFDLNLTPYENDLEFAKRPPILDCFLAIN